MNSYDKIIHILAEKPGLKAKEIARLLRLKKKEINSVLYGTLNSRLVQDSSYRWWLKSVDGELKTTEQIQNLTKHHVQYDNREESLPMLGEAELGCKPELVKKETTEEVESHTFNITEDNPIRSHKSGEEQDIQQHRETDHSRRVTRDEPIINEYKCSSLPYPTIEEEKNLWRRFIKWRHVKEILSSGHILNDMPGAGSVILSQIVEEISISHDLIVLLRRHAGLEELGDSIIENAENNTNITIELYRLIQHSKKKHNQDIERSPRDSCYLEDLFGFIFGEILNNIVFGTGNPNLVNKITKTTNESLGAIRNRLFMLAINRELLPRSIMKLVNPKTPLHTLPDQIENILPDHFSEYVVNDYQPFITNVRLDGEKALNTIIESHLRLVVSIANEFVAKELVLPVEDMIQEGMIGLISAAENYTPAHDIRFRAYVPKAIHQMIYRAIADKTHIMHVPVHMIEATNQLMHIRHRLAHEYGREPTAEEIAIEMEVSLDTIIEILQFSKQPILLDSSIHKEEDLLLKEEDYFLDKEENYIGGNPIIDMIDKNALRLDDAITERLLKEQIENVLCTLTPREQRVVELRFGLIDGRKLTLEKVGRQYNVTRERIRQIEDKALRKLRHPSRSRKLKDFLK